MGSLKWCSSHCRQDLRLEPEVLQQSTMAKQLKIRRGHKACWHHWDLGFMDYGQLLPQKFRPFVLGRKFFDYRRHHRVSERGVDCWPPGQLLSVLAHPMGHLVRWRCLGITEAVVTWRFRHVLSTTMDLETVWFSWEYLLHREVLEGWRSRIQSLR